MRRYVSIAAMICPLFLLVGTIGMPRDAGSPCKIPAHGFVRLDLPTREVIEEGKKTVNNVIVTKRLAADDRKIAALVRILEIEQGALNRDEVDYSRLRGILESRSITKDDWLGKHTSVGGLASLPNGMTLIAASKAGCSESLFFFSRDGRLLKTVSVPNGEDAKICGWREVAQIGLFWFPISDRSLEYGVVFSYVLGAPFQKSGFASYVFGQVFMVTEKEEVIRGPLVYGSGIDLWNDENPDTKKPSTSRALVCDANDDGFRDVVFWKRNYSEQEGENCLRLENEEAVLVLFSSEKNGFQEPVDATTLLPFDEDLWYGLLEKPNGEEKRIWPIESDPAESVVGSEIYCEGDLPCPTQKPHPG